MKWKGENSVKSRGWCPRLISYAWSRWQVLVQKKNVSPHRSPPEGAAVTGVQMCVCLCAQGLPKHIINQLFMCLYTFPVVRYSLCMCACAYLCVHIRTVILCDRMITPFSLQPRGVSQLHCSPSPSPKGVMCFHICQSLFPVGSNAPLHLLRFSPPVCLPT